MKLHLFQDEKQTEDRIDIYYATMTPVIQKVIDVVHAECPVLKSKEEGETVYINLEAVYYLDCVDKKVFAYTLISLCAAVINTIAGTQNTNFNGSALW